MPPWPPEPNYGDFAGTRRLTETQINQLTQWAAAGAPQGDPTKTPPIPHYTQGWKLGPPDLILKMPKPFNLQASEKDVFRNFVIPVNLNQSRYVKAVELHPGNPKVVHHANVIIDRARSLRSRDTNGQGFPGMDVETESGGEDFEPDSHFLFWKPGTVAQPDPEDMAWRLDPNTDLVINLHMQPSGKPESIQAEIGLYFTDRPPSRKPILVQLEHDGAIDMAPGATAAVTDELKLPVAAQLLAIYPHAHYIGKRIEAWAILPTGKRVELLRINNWDINWQAAYSYSKPIELPSNTRLMMRITYNNTTTKRVRAGNRSEDEMGHVWLQLLPLKDKSDADPRLAVHLAVMRRRLEKYPADFLAHYNLGAALQSLGDHKESTQYLEKAVRLRPDSLTARNTLGVGYMLADQLDRAAQEFKEVIKQQPHYANAHFNLARVLAAQSDANGATREFEAFLEIEPDDGRGHALLAGVLAATGHIAEATPHFRKAVESDPKNADAWTNLGTALAIGHDYTGAIEALENALKIEPNHEKAKTNLARARADLARQRPRP